MEIYTLGYDIENYIFGCGIENHIDKFIIKNYKYENKYEDMLKKKSSKYKILKFILLKNPPWYKNIFKTRSEYILNEKWICLKQEVNMFKTRIEYIWNETNIF